MQGIYTSPLLKKNPLTIASNIKYINCSSSVSRPSVIWFYLIGKLPKWADLNAF